MRYTNKNISSKKGKSIDINNGSLFPIVSFEKQFIVNKKSLLNQTRKKQYKQRIKLIKKFYNNTQFNPKDDFYNWVNYDWLKNFKIPEGDKYIVEFDDFRLVQRKVYEQLFDIIENYLKTSKNTTFGKCLNTFYNSTKTFSSLEELRINSDNMIMKLDNLMKDDNKENLWVLLGLFNKTAGELNSVGLPFVYDMSPDGIEPIKFRPVLNGPSFIMVDINVYFDDCTDYEYKAKYKRHYFKTIMKLFDTIFGKGHGFDPNDIFQIEVKMLNAYGKITEKEDPNSYNIITKTEALSKYKFNWDIFCKTIGFEKTPDWFITNSVNYLKYGTEMLLNEWNTKALRTYFIFNYVRQTALFCKKTREIIYQFRGKFERGEQGDIINENISGIFELGLAFNTFLSNQYIKKYKNENNIKYLEILTEELRQIFIRMIQNNKWLSSNAQNSAILKLNDMKIIIGSQPILRKDPILHYTDNLLENMIMIFQWRFNQTLLLDGKSTKNVDIPTMDWSQYPPKFTGTQAYVVNASYTPIKNSIYIPLGYIQKPFIDMTMSIEYILAHVGFTIGHEMSHCLDDWGSKYDQTGRLYDWFTKKDKIIFKKKQDDILAQYKEFAKRDGITYDVELGLGEDMADISGLAICVEYLANLHKFQNKIMPIQKLSFEQFFIYYAYQMRQKIFKRALNANLKTNPHPLDKYRTNIPLSRSIIFREIFDIKKDNKMWWHNTDTIW